MAAITADRLSFRYGGVHALNDVSFEIPEGSLYALLGPNGAGKTTLLQILAGLRRPQTGSASVLGRDATKLTATDRAEITFVAEGQPAHDWMRLEQLEAFLSPLYPTWDATLATELRRRFRLDPRRKLKTLSKGERMKAALLCVLAPRPRVLMMDEPFTGMDAMVKDEIVSGLLELAGTEGWTVLISSHDIAELELLVDHVGLLADGQLRLSESMDSVRDRFRQVEITLGDAVLPKPRPEWLSVRSAGRRVSFVTSQSAHGDDVEAHIRREVPNASRIETRPASLREVFVAVAGSPDRELSEPMSPQEVAS